MGRIQERNKRRQMLIDLVGLVEYERHKAIIEKYSQYKDFQIKLAKLKFRVYVLKYGFLYKNKEVIYIGKTSTPLELRYSRHVIDCLEGKSPHFRILKSSLQANRNVSLEYVDFPTENQAIYNFYSNPNFLITNLAIGGGCFIEQRNKWSSMKNFKNEFELLDKLLNYDENFDKEEI